MPEISTIILILIAVVVVLVLYKLLKSVKKLLINTIMGFVLIFLSSAVGLTPLELVWPINLVTTIVCALGGVIGAVLLIIASLLGII